MTEHARKPRAIRIEPAQPSRSTKPGAPSRKPRALHGEPRIRMIPDDAADNGVPETLPRTPVAKRFAWLTLLSTALLALISLATGLAIDQFVRDLFARSNWLGWTAATLAALAGLAAAALIGREAFGLVRMRSIAKLRDLGAKAHRQNDARLARLAADEIAGLFGGRAEAARGRAAMALHRDEIIDGADLIELCERDLLAPFDKSARRLVADSAKRVSVVTAISPRAIVDVAYVLWENLGLIRAISALYGGRPGTLGLLRLSRQVVTHLAATGAIAAGDSLLQQLVGHGLAARLSARLGEGVLNGLLTARIGISAIEVCRPMQFVAAKRPGLADFIGELAPTWGKTEAERSHPLDKGSPNGR